ncbi:Sugar_tr domain-containing protein [Cephalotus follicularis]|uniref:Sugar_tr domain-containing protein n=1 Tax=Cephalotus follicularis TaxID=3775 RepID=A0A1Q3BSV5_CEPFO|nr:Sugar_tr domain-containing protein [Cephalotus follicularis]
MVLVFIIEIAPTNLCGGLTTLNQLLIFIGASLAFLVGSTITWRTLALRGLIPCIILVVGLCFVPESPRWLAKVGLKNEYQVALLKVCGINADISHEAAAFRVYNETFRSLPKARMLDVSVGNCFRFVVIGVAFGMPKICTKNIYWVVCALVPRY